MLPVILSAAEVRQILALIRLPGYQVCLTTIYSILFDTGKSTLKPESKAAIAEIAKLMNNRPTLKLFVVGHTDSTGGFEANMKLSRDRAAAVTQSLVSDYGIEAARLTPHGVGPLSPVATNTIEEGRTKNRRVDLVAQ